MRLVVLGAGDFIDSTRIEDAGTAEAPDHAAAVTNPEADSSICDVLIPMSHMRARPTGVTPQNELGAIIGEAFSGPRFEDTYRVPPDVSKLKKLGWQPQSISQRLFGMQSSTTSTRRPTNP